MAHKWTDKDKKRHSDRMKEVWKTPGYREKIMETNRERREAGLNLVNIDQRANPESYREYQRLQHRLWYAKNRNKWNRYSSFCKLRKKPMNVLQELYKKHIRNGNLDWAECVMDAIRYKENQECQMNLEEN